MIVICENFTLSKAEMPYLRHLRAFKTVPWHNPAGMSGFYFRK